MLVLYAKPSNKMYFLIFFQGQDEFLTNVRNLREQSESACQVVQIAAFRTHGMLANHRLLRLKKINTWGDFDVFLGN